MGIIREHFFNMRCDCCGEILNDEYWTSDEDGVKFNAENSDWTERGGKWYCPNCWHYNEDDNIETKDGKVWDGEIDKLKYERLNTPNLEG